MILKVTNYGTRGITCAPYQIFLWTQSHEVKRLTRKQTQSPNHNHEKGGWSRGRLTNYAWLEFLGEGNKKFYDSDEDFSERKIGSS